jgi:diguanylate cyclase (GGDEF)-like protein
MTIGTQWKEQTAQKLVRYEALFALIDNIQMLEDIASISRRVSAQWKYFANVTSWRLVVMKDCGFQVVDGFRGDAHVDDVTELSPWDSYLHKLHHPRLLLLADPLVGPRPPEHLTGQSITEIAVLPFIRKDRCIGLLSVAARHEPFNELDNKFIRIFGSHFADRISDILLRRAATEVLISKATKDALTGLLNRGTIIERLCSQRELALRTGQPLSVILADIDFFKVINDSYGHLVGDQVLREISQRLQAQTRASDHLGRYGGEEFLFVLYPCDASTAGIAAERFCRAIAEIPFSLENSSAREINVTISLGASSTADPAEALVEDLLKQVDDALYRSKANGRNRVTMAKL